jgi:hypothetical protein
MEIFNISDPTIFIFITFKYHSLTKTWQGKKFRQFKKVISVTVFNYEIGFYII